MTPEYPALSRTRTRPPVDCAEPGATRDRSRVDQAKGRERRAERDEHVRHVAAPSESQPATAGRDRQPRQVCEQRPGEPPGTLRGEVERQAEPEPGQPFDAVLLDAPCTGLGTLARYPEDEIYAAAKVKVVSAVVDAIGTTVRGVKGSFWP